MYSLLFHNVIASQNSLGGSWTFFNPGVLLNSIVDVIPINRRTRFKNYCRGLDVACLFFSV
jgi:hypothetical protein